VALYHETPNTTYAKILMCESTTTTLSASGPAGVLSQRVNQMLRVPNLDGMQGGYTGIYPGSGKRRPYVQRGGGSIVFPCT
jgi:hypothetical protein